MTAKTAVARVLLPQPPERYDPASERNRNREIERQLNGKLGRTELPVFGGIPFTAVRGLNPAFIVPPGPSPTLLPFNVLLEETDLDITFDPADYTMRANFTVDVMMFVRIRHAGTGGGGVSVDWTLHGFLNGAEIDTFATSTRIGGNFDIMATFMAVNAPVNQRLDLRMSHTHNADVPFDMTRSRWWLTRISPDPRVLESRL
jgi:hypothetical protein